MNLSYVRALAGLLAVLLLSACGGDEEPSPVRAPANVRAEAVGRLIRVAWDYRGEAAFHIYRATDGEGFERLTAEPLSAIERSFDDVRVSAGVAYRYAVSAVGPLGESARVESPTPARVELEPEPPPGSYRLEVRRSSDSSGAGTIESSPVGISCDNVSGTGCSADFPEGTEVLLRARAGEGSVFAGWSGPCSGTAECTLTLNADATVTATFKPAQAVLTVSADGSGSVRSVPAGIECGEACSASYAVGTAVSLQATPEEGNAFVGWSGACSGAGACTVRLEADEAVTAFFERATLPEPVIEAFTASPERVRAGDEVTLRWETENAETLSLSSDTGLEPTDVSGETSFETRQTKDTLYTLTASNEGGSATASVRVRVGRPPAIEAFGASPTTIAPGETSTLSWTVTGDAPLALSIDRGVGDVSGETSARVEPDRDTTYTLTARNDFGTDEAEVRVRVKPRHLLTLTREGAQQSRVTSAEPPGIDCGSTCSASFFENTEVTLQVETPGNLDHWYICDEATSPNWRWLFCRREDGKRLEFGMNRDKFVYAVFKY